MENIIDQYQPEMVKILDHLSRELQNIRTGRATPSLVENITVSAYNVKTPLIQLATISTPDPKTIHIQPWDKNITKAIEAAIREADIGLQPVVDNEIIRISLPMLTKENRQQLARLVKRHLEDTRICIRSQRDKIKDQIINKEKAKEISEDDRFRLIKKLDEFIRKYLEMAETLALNKEKEIMEI